MDKIPTSSISTSTKITKTASYTRKSVDAYQQRNKEKIKEYHRQYYQRKKQEKNENNPNRVYTIDELIKNYNESNK